MKIIWDEPKRLATLDERNLDFAIITEAFFEQAKAIPAKAGRFKAIGWIDGRAYAVVFRPLGSEAFSIISLRLANPKERRLL